MNSENSNMPTTQGGGTVPAPQVDPYAAYGAASATGTPFLKFDRGVYKYGPADESEIAPTGTLVVANMPEMMVGWLKWIDGEVVAEAMRRLADGYYVQPREELGDTDESLWEMGNDDLPKDPWAETTTLPLKDPATGAEYTFTTSSKGGRSACGKLSNTYGEQRHQPGNGGKLPVIKLDASTYKHRKLNQVVHFPVFRLVEWRSEDDLIHGANGADVPDRPKRADYKVADDLNDEVPF